MQEKTVSGAVFVERDPGTPRAFLVTLTGAPLHTIQEIVLASSWSISPHKGIIRFFDDHGRLAEAFGLERLVQVRALTDGPIVWTDGDSVNL